MGEEWLPHVNASGTTGCCCCSNRNTSSLGSDHLMFFYLVYVLFGALSVRRRGKVCLHMHLSNHIIHTAIIG